MIKGIQGLIYQMYQPNLLPSKTFSLPFLLLIKNKAMTSNEFKINDVNIIKSFFYPKRPITNKVKENRGLI